VAVADRVPETLEAPPSLNLTGTRSPTCRKWESDA